MKEFPNFKQCESSDGGQKIAGRCRYSDLDIQDAFRKSKNNGLNKKNLTSFPAAMRTKRNPSYLNEEPEIRSKNDFLKERLDKQVKELPKASRSQFEFEVRKFKLKTLQDYLICEVCKQPKKDGCNCGSSGPMYST